MLTACDVCPAVSLAYRIMRVNVSWTSWAALAWARIFPRGSPDLFLPSFAQSTVCWCIMFFIICYRSLSLSFFFLSLAHSHLPQCWTASNRAWWLKEMSVHSLIIPQRAVLLTVLIQSYRASLNCSLVVSHGTLWVFIWVCVCVLVVNLSLLSSLLWLYSQ